MANLADRVIGRAEGSLTRRTDESGECVLGDVVADAVQNGCQAWGSSLAALVALTDLRADVTGPMVDGAVEIRYGVAVSALPVAQGTLVVELSGAQLIGALEEQAGGGRVAVSRELRYAQSAGARLDVSPRAVTIGGALIRMTEPYRVAVSDSLWASADFPSLRKGKPVAGGARLGQELDHFAAYLTRFDVLPLPRLDRTRGSSS